MNKDLKKILFDLNGVTMSDRSRVFVTGLIKIAYSAGKAEELREQIAYHEKRNEQLDSIIERLNKLTGEEKENDKN